MSVPGFSAFSKSRPLEAGPIGGVKGVDRGLPPTSKPEYVGRSCFYCAVLDEQLRLDHENPTLGLVLCKSADAVQVRLALTEAAHRIGVATDQTGLPDAALIERRLAELHLEYLPDEPDSEEAGS